jgi:hypothetical protein
MIFLKIIWRMSTDYFKFWYCCLFYKIAIFMKNWRKGENHRNMWSHHWPKFKYTFFS